MLTVATHTPSEPGPFFDAAIESARHALKWSSAVHSIITVKPGEYYEARKAAWQSGGYVGLLDSDDYFPACFSLRDFEKHLTGAGVVYGREERVNSDGARISDRSREASAEDIAELPSGIHHFAAINTDCIEPSVFKAVESSGAMYCLDWVVRSYAALVHGATFVNVHSYNWRQHPGQVTHREAKEVARALAAASGIVRGFYRMRCNQWLKRTPT